MNKYTLIGIVSCLGGICTYGFQGLKGLMDKNNVWENIALVDISEDLIYGISDALPFEFLQQGFDFLAIDLPLYQLLLAIGVLFLLLGSFFKQ